MDGDYDSDLDRQSDSGGELVMLADVIDIDGGDERDDGEETEDLDSDYDVNDDESGDDSDNGEMDSTEPRTSRPAGHCDEEEEEDDVIKAIIANTKTERTHPPDINIDDFVVDLSFHPEQDILAVGTMSGDTFIYKYTVDENTLVNTLELHTKAIRDIEFSMDGKTLYSTSKDRSILLSDFETGKFLRLYQDAHDQPVSRLNVFGETGFATGKWR